MLLAEVAGEEVVCVFPLLNFAIWLNFVLVVSAWEVDRGASMFLSVGMGNLNRRLTTTLSAGDHHRLHSGVWLF